VLVFTLDLRRLGNVTLGRRISGDRGPPRGRAGNPAAERRWFFMFDIADPYGPVVRGLLLTAAALLWTILLVRIVGLRAFSKMTAMDFVTTIATGSLIAQAGTRAVWSEYLQALAAIAGVFLIQWLLAKARLNSKGFQKVIKNKPVLLMEDGEFLEAAMSATRVSRSSIMEKLRRADVRAASDVKAMVLETTGDISILRKDGFDERLLEGVQRISTAETG
jgi:uncharacterized membrane protein YcaP (DUF421 family)